MNSKTKAIIAWVLVSIWAAAIYNFSTDAFNAGRTLQVIETVGIHGHLANSINHVARKSAHFTEYAILGLLASITALACWPRIYLYRGPVLVMVCCSLYALSDEAHQVFVPSRGPAVKDVILDSFGAGFAIYAFYRFNAAQRLAPVEEEAPA
jgi:VanZ family protein